MHNYESNANLLVNFNVKFLLGYLKLQPSIEIAGAAMLTLCMATKNR